MILSESECPEAVSSIRWDFVEIGRIQSQSEKNKTRYYKQEGQCEPNPRSRSESGVG